MKRVTRLWLVLGVLVGPLVAACGDAEGSAPVAPVLESVGRDLDLVLPAVRHASRVVSNAVRRVPETPAERLQFANASSGGSEQAWIYDRFVTAYFSADELRFEYGMAVYGTGYSMRPTILVTRADGSVLPTESGSGISVNLNPVAIWMSPARQEMRRFGVACGLMADVGVEFKAWIGIDMPSFKLGLNSGVEDRAATSQPGCAEGPVYGSGGGSTGGEDGHSFSICYYEVWVDLDGNIVDVIPLGCRKITNYAV